MSGRQGTSTPPGGARPFSGAMAAMAGLFGRAVTQMLALGVTLLAARWLTPAAFGEYAIAAALVTVSRALLYAGAFEYLLKTPRGEEAATECLVINLALAVGLAGILASLSLTADRVFHATEIGVLLLAMGPSNLLSAMANWQESQLLRAGRLKTYYGVTTFSELVAAGLTVTMILNGFGLWALVVQIYSRLFSLMVTYRTVQKPAWSRTFSWARALDVGRWSAARYGATMVAFLSDYSADFLLGVFLSPAATGLYRASHRVVTAVSDLINNPLRVTAVTLFSRRAADGLQSGPLWPRVAAAAALIGWTAMAGLAAVSGQLVPLVLGNRWRAAGMIVSVLCLQRAFALVDGVTTQLFVAYGRARTLLAIQASVAIASVVLLVVFARFGARAVAFSTAIVSAASMLGCATLAAHTFKGLLKGLPQVLPVALTPAVATGSAAVAASRLAPAGLGAVARLALEIGAGAAAFALAAYALRRSVADVLESLDAPARVRTSPKRNRLDASAALAG